jgi:hypothetical protein
MRAYKSDAHFCYITAPSLLLVIRRFQLDGDPRALECQIDATGSVKSNSLGSMAMAKAVSSRRTKSELLRACL